ncbi:LamG domain-containing protein [Prosthecobacter sp. SYSU 5D2]|uniref:LamG domain-containing protein n=1 Tax=Prosthecobacter sp. SYSU 5D2 TaxID=3134134 RepID=UPI0031FE892D
MRPVFLLCLAAGLLPVCSSSQDLSALRSALTFHAPFEEGLDASFSRGEKTAYVKKGKETVPAALNEEVKIAQGEGKFGHALWFPKKGVTRPLYKGAEVLNYNAQSWSTSVSVWLRLDPDKDLEPGYCDPVQIVGDDGKKGFIFLEWSKDETPRFFRYAMRPLVEIWNPTNVLWDEIPADKRPMVQLDRTQVPFSREAWTHVVFTVENVNDKTRAPAGRLYMNGELKGSIENWDLTFGWDSTQVALVLGAAYVGYLDDLAVFNRALTAAEVKQLGALKTGVRELYPAQE